MEWFLAYVIIGMALVALGFAYDRPSEAVVSRMKQVGLVWLLIAAATIVLMWPFEFIAAFRRFRKAKS